MNFFFLLFPILYLTPSYYKRNSSEFLTLLTPEETDLILFISIHFFFNFLIHILSFFHFNSISTQYTHTNKQNRHHNHRNGVGIDELKERET